MKNQRATSYTNKDYDTAIFMNKNQYATASMGKISFSRGFTNVQDSRREKPTCNKFQKQNSVRNKFQEQKSVRNKFHEQNQFHG